MQKGLSLRKMDFQAGLI